MKQVSHIQIGWETGGDKICVLCNDKTYLPRNNFVLADAKEATCRKCIGLWNKAVGLYEKSN